MCSQCKIYNNRLPTVPAMLAEYGLQLYSHYKYKNSDKFDCGDDELIDPRDLTLDTTEGRDIIESLRVFTIVLAETQDRSGEPIIPRYDEYRIPGLSKDEFELLCSYTFIDKIHVFDSTTLETHVFATPFDAMGSDENDRDILYSLFKLFSREQPDVVQWFNVKDFNFIYQRSRHLGLTSEFLSSMPRNFHGYSETMLEMQMFPTNKYNPTSQLNNYSQFTDECMKGFRCTCVGRIMINYIGFIHRTEEFMSWLDLTNIRELHAEILSKTRMILSCLGPLGLSSIYVNKHSTICQWAIIRWYNEDSRVILWPDSTNDYEKEDHDEDDRDDEDNAKLSGALTFHSNLENTFGNISMHRSIENRRIIASIDISGCYPFIVINYGLCPSTVTSKQISEDQEHVVLIDNKAEIDVWVSKSPGITPCVLRLLSERRRECLLKLEKTTDPVYRAILIALERGLKMISVKIYGIFGQKWKNNSLASIITANLITARGRQIFRQLGEYLQEKSEVIIGHTDGYIVSCRSQSIIQDHIKKFGERIGMDIRVKNDRCFQSLAVVPETSYVGIDLDRNLVNRGVIKTKRNSLLGVRLERYIWKALLTASDIQGNEKKQIIVKKTIEMVLEKLGWDFIQTSWVPVVVPNGFLQKYCNYKEITILRCAAIMFNIQTPDVDVIDEDGEVSALQHTTVMDLKRCQSTIRAIVNNF